MKNILRALDKCFSLPDNYPKRKGTYFKHWCVTYYPDYPFYPVEWTMGARNDMFSEGSVAAYTNTWLHKLFLEKLLSTIDVKNILQENLFTILSSVEMIAMSRPMSILHFYINVPMWWLDEKKNTLSDHDWYVKSMGRAIDFLYDTMLKLEKDSWKMLDERLMFNFSSRWNSNHLTSMSSTSLI